MSAFISVADDAAACLLTDGASYDNDGVVLSIGRKVTVGQSVPIAVTTRGNDLVGRILAKTLCDVADTVGVDVMMIAMEDLLQAPKLRSKYHELDGVHLHVAAWSETRGVVRLSWHNLPTAFSDGEEPLRLFEPVGAYVAGNVCTAQEYARQGVTSRRPGEPLVDYAERIGGPMLQAMRLKPARLMEYETATEPQYLIGGQVDLAVVTQNGVTVKTLRQWPDVIGQKINPEWEVVSL